MPTLAPRFLKLVVGPAAVSLTLAAACSRSTQPPPPPPAAPEAESPAFAYSMRTLERTDGDCASPAGCCRVRVEAPAIQRAATPDARRRLNRFIQDDWLAASFGAHPGRSLDDLVEALFRRRREALAGQPGTSATWWVRRGIDVLYEDSQVISLRYGDDSYTGGESPIHEVLLASFDFATGERLSLAALVSPERHEILRSLVEARFRQVRGVPPGASLKAWGFEVPGNALPLSGNFAVAEAGLLFRYNPFAIAGEAGTEPTQILLTRGELRDLVAAGSPLAAAPRLRAAFPSPEAPPPELQDPEGLGTTDVPR
jgi:hypothetical protein